MSILHFARDSDRIMPASVARTVITGAVTAPRKRPSRAWRWIEPALEMAAGAVMVFALYAFLIGI